VVSCEPPRPIREFPGSARPGGPALPRFSAPVLGTRRHNPTASAALRNGAEGPGLGPKGAEPTQADLSILEALAADPSLSQRELAERAGLSVARAHFVLKRLTEKGLIKVRNARRSRHKLGYLYLLTPRGLEAKAKLTYRFMHRMAMQYRSMVERVDSVLAAALDGLVDGAAPVPRPVPVSILGQGPLSEVVRDLVGVNGELRLVDHHEDAILGIVVDPDVDRPAPGPRRWVDLG
jgi:EPS-associated MarR family transcriptional regulator